MRTYFNRPFFINPQQEVANQCLKTSIISMPRKRQSTERAAASASSRGPSKRVKKRGLPPKTDKQPSQANQYPVLAS